jgi:PAS domain S-box-containing protein
MASQQAAIGFDLGSEENRRSTLLRSAKQLESTISSPLRLVQGGEGTVSFIAGLPMERFAGDRPSAYIAGSFLLAVISFENSTLFSDFGEDSHFSELRLLTRNGEDWIELLQWTREGDQPDTDQDLTAVRRIEVGGQMWRLELRPSASFVKAGQTVMPNILSAGVVGLWIVLIAGGFLQLRLFQEISRRRHSRILDSVLANVDEGIVVAGPDGRLLFFNESARKFVGRVDDSIPVSQWPTRVGAYRPDGETLLSPAELPLVRAMRGEVVPATEVFVKNSATPNGAWVTVTGKPLVDETGQRKGGVVVIRDQTQEKAAQATMDRLAQAVESTADAVFITDRTGTIEYVNAAFERTTGFMREEALGEKPRILKSGQHDGAFYGALWSDLLQGRNHSCTVINRTKRGQLFTAEETIAPMRDAGGRVTHFVAVLKDMTETLKRREQEVELRLAAEVQRKLYPEEPPDLAGWDLAGLVVPAEQTCGDYYDFIELENGALAMAVGDVSGHGLGPALVMSEARALLRATSRMIADPAEVMARVNGALSQDLDDHFFVTMLLATLDPGTRRLEWVNAGHPSGYVIDSDGGLKAELTSQTIPLGILPQYAAVHGESVLISPGDVVLLVTDGVTEWGELRGEPFGPERTLNTLREFRQLSASKIADHLMAELRAFSDSEQTDDVTMIVCKAS